MWTIIKIDKKKLNIFKEDLTKKLGSNFQFYCPKLIVQKYKNNKLIKKEFNLLDDYMLCYHNDFNNPQTINRLKFIRGLKYFLNGFLQSQDDIKKFISKCKESENNGYLSIESCIELSWYMGLIEYNNTSWIDKETNEDITEYDIYLKYEKKINNDYKFASGPFAETIFKIINLQKNKIDILMGNIKTTINRQKFLINPV